MSEKHRSQINFDAEEDLKTQFFTAATARGKTGKDVLTEFVSDYVQQWDKQGRPVGTDGTSTDDSSKLSPAKDLILDAAGHGKTGVYLHPGLHAKLDEILKIVPPGIAAGLLQTFSESLEAARGKGLEDTQRGRAKRRRRGSRKEAAG